jgi:RNA polymerase primary sigma factor
LRRRFGIGGAPHTYEEIAVLSGVSREQIRRVERRALKALRESARVRNARDFLDADV